MTNFEIRVTADLLRPAVIGVRGQGIALQKGDSRAHSIVCDVVRGGDPVELDGFTAAVYAQYGSTKYKLTDTTVSGHTVTSVIDPGIYSNLAGVVTFAVKLTNAAQGIDMTAAIIIAVIEQAVSDGAPQVPTSEAWTEAVIVRYLDQLKRNVDTFDELKADIEKDVQDFLGNVVYDADQAVNDWLNEHFADATWRITEDDKREIAQMVSINVDNAAAEHIRNATIHVTESDKAKWNGKQDVISDLSQIRNNGYKAVNALGEYDAWNSGTSYIVGNYCIYDNKLWRCILVHSGQRPIEGTYWENVTLSSVSKKTKIDIVAGPYNTVEHVNCYCVNGRVSLNLQISLNNGSYGIDAYNCAMLNMYYPPVPVVCYAVNTGDASAKRIYPCFITTQGQIAISIGDTIANANKTIMIHSEYTIA